MKKFLPVLCLTALLAAPSFAVTVVDDSGTKVTLPHPPQRIISVTPATTEMLFAIGDGPRVVGGTTSDDYPPAALKIAHIGTWVPNYEKIVAMRPDLVVVDDNAEHNAVGRLRALHVTVLVIRPTTLAAVESDIRLIGRATGSTKGANAVINGMRKKIKEAAAIAARDPRRPRVLPVIGHAPLFVAGRGTFIDDAVRDAGGVDVVNAAGYVQYSPESVVADQPDVILASPDDSRAMTGVAAYRAVAAVRAHRFISIDEGLLQRPGPRLADGVLQLAIALHQGR